MFAIRTARMADLPELQRLIARSAFGLREPYTLAQVEGLVRHVFGVDTQLVADGTYFVIEEEGAPVACGGWGQRRTLYGGDQAKTGPDPLLDPATEAARIRAFFVDPDRARRGLGRMLMAHCSAHARAAGFRALELVSTLPGEPLYLASGFRPLKRFELDLPEGVRAPVTLMRLDF